MILLTAQSYRHPPDTLCFGENKAAPFTTTPITAPTAHSVTLTQVQVQGRKGPLLLSRPSEGPAGAVGTCPAVLLTSKVQL